MEGRSSDQPRPVGETDPPRKSNDALVASHCETNTQPLPIESIRVSCRSLFAGDSILDRLQAGSYNRISRIARRQPGGSIVRNIVVGQVTLELALQLLAFDFGFQLRGE